MDGGYAEYVKVRQDAVVPIPRNVSLREASVVTCTLGTAYHAVTTRGNIQPGEAIVVTGASGGVGLHIIGIAKRQGAHIIAITSSERKGTIILEAGADELIVTTPDMQFAKEVKRRTNGLGSDAVLDIVGSATLDQSIRSLRKGGRIVLVGNINGKQATIKPAHFILKEISLVGTRACTLSELEEVLQLLANKEVSIYIDSLLPLEKGVEAHQLMEHGVTRGRVVLEISPEVT